MSFELFLFAKVERTTLPGRAADDGTGSQHGEARRAARRPEARDRDAGHPEERWSGTDWIVSTNVSSSISIA